MPIARHMLKNINENINELQVEIFFIKVSWGAWDLWFKKRGKPGED